MRARRWLNDEDYEYDDRSAQKRRTEPFQDFRLRRRQDDENFFITVVLTTRNQTTPSRRRRLGDTTVLIFPEWFLEFSARFLSSFGRNGTGFSVRNRKMQSYAIPPTRPAFDLILPEYCTAGALPA